MCFNDMDAGFEDESTASTVDPVSNRRSCIDEDESTVDPMACIETWISGVKRV